MTETNPQTIEQAEYTLINPGPESGQAELRTFYELTQSFHVKGLTSTTTYERLKEATQNSIIPGIGSYHPDNETMWVTKITARPAAQNSATVTVYYEKAPDAGFIPPVYEIGSSQIASETAYKYDGTRITITKDGKKYYGKCPFVKSGMVVRVSVTGYSFAHALDQAATYNDTVSDGGPLNQGVVTIGSKSYGPARTWLCQVSARSSGIGNTFTIDYEFSYNPYTWDAVATFEDEDGIELKDDSVTLDACQVQVQRSTNFPVPELF